MKQNLGIMDCRIRRIIAWTLVLMMVLKLIDGLWAWTATFTAILLLFTAFMHYCPLYKLFRINTFHTKKIR